MAYMGSVSSLGVGSGIDLTSLLNNLMQAESIPLNRLKQQTKTVESQVSAYGTLKSSLTSFQDAAKKLTSTSFNATTVSSSDEKIATVKSTSNQPSGSFTLEVNKLATASKVASGQVANTERTSGTGSINFTFDNNTSFSVDISAGASLSEIRDSINRENKDISATILNEGNEQRLVFTSKKTGSEFNFEVTTSGLGTTFSNAIDFPPLTVPPVGGIGLPITIGTAQRTVTGQDAEFKIDGIALTSASNTVTTAIDGLEISLVDTTTAGRPIQLNITQDASAPEKALNEFISAYNSMLDAVGKLTLNTPQAAGADPSERNNGPLAADSTVRSVMAEIRNAVFDVVPGFESPYNNLASVGVRTKQDGKLELDTKTFKTAMSTDASAVAKLFGFQESVIDKTKPGITQSISETIDRLTKRGGIIDGRVEGLNSTSKNLQNQQEAMQLRLTQIEANYRRQFSSLDVMISGMQSQSNYLSQQLASLATLR